MVNEITGEKNYYYLIQNAKKNHPRFDLGPSSPFYFRFYYFYKHEEVKLH